MKAIKISYPPEAKELPLVCPDSEAGWMMCGRWEIQWLLWKAAQTTGNILEVGVNLGVTTREFSHAFPSRHIFAVDWINPAGPVHLLEWQRGDSLQQQEKIGYCARALPNVVLLLQDSTTFDYTGRDIGFVFIDGNHSFNGVKADTELALASFERTRRPMTIAWHDYCATQTEPHLYHRDDVGGYLDDSDLPIRWVEGTILAYLDLP